MARNQSMDPEFLKAALLGFEQEKSKIETKIAELKRAIGGKNAPAQEGRGSASSSGRRELSPEARRRIAAAQRKRWAAYRKTKAAA